MESTSSPRPGPLLVDGRGRALEIPTLVRQKAASREWCTELLAGDAATVARRYCHLLAGHTGVDAQAIWEWGFLERVSSGLYALSFGAEELGRPLLATAELLLD